MQLQRFPAVLVTFLLPGIALAQPAAPQGMGAISQFIFLGGFILIFYFLVWRPQSKRAKEHKALVSGIAKGDEVLTGGGLAGRVTRLTDDFMVLEVSDKVEIKVQRVSVSSVLPKGTLKDI